MQSSHVDEVLGRRRDGHSSRQTPDGFQPDEHSLLPAHCEIAGGFVFVCIAETPPDFTPVRALGEPYLAPFDLARTRVAATSTVVENGNWKPVMENNRECFHAGRPIPSSSSSTGTPPA